MSEIKKIRVETAAEAEKKDRQKAEAEKKAEIAKALEVRKEKEKLLERLDKDKKLAFLKSMVERDLIAVSTVEAIVSGEALDTDEVEEIFSKIDEIEQTHDVERILPKELRISKDEYLLAMRDVEFRNTALIKIDAALAHLYHSSNPNPFSAISFFGGFMMALDKSLVRVQENTIDIKRSIQAAPVA